MDDEPIWAHWSRASTLIEVLGYINQGVSEGATLVVDGRDFVV